MHKDSLKAAGLAIASFAAVAGIVMIPASAVLADTQSSDFESDTVGSVNGQDGWSMTGSYDVDVVNTSDFGSPSGMGTKALRISNAVTSGAFGDQTFAKPLTETVGEAEASTTTGTTQTHYEASFDIASAATSSEQTGLVLSVSPDDGQGSRMSYLRFEDQADGIDVYFDDVTDAGPLPTTATFNESKIATLDRTTVHHVKFTMDTVDGPANDVVQIYIDGNLVKQGTSWEDYYRYDAEQTGNGNKLPAIKTLLFRAGGTAAPSTSGEGFLIDNVSLTSGGSASTVVTAPSITSTAVTTGAEGSSYTYNVTTGGTPGSISASGLPNGVTIHDNGDGTAVISGTPTESGTFAVTVSDVNAAGSANQHYNLHVTGTWYVDASNTSGVEDGSQTHPYNTIQEAVTAAGDGDTIEVANGTYSGDVVVSSKDDLTLEAANGATINLGSGYGISLDNGGNTQSKNFTMKGFTVNASVTTTYALKAYKADGLTLEDDTFSGGSGNTGGGVDVNTTDDVTLKNVTSTGFHKNGFAVTSKYQNGDNPGSGATFDGITSSNNGWAGIAFYTMNGAGTVGANLDGVTFTGSSTISGNGQGIFVEGDSDANFGANATPTYTVTTDGSTLSLGSIAMTGNTQDIVNYQTADVNAVNVTFSGKTGYHMNASERAAEDAKIYDQNDLASLGLVTYWEPDTTAPVITINGDNPSSAEFGSTYVDAGATATDDVDGSVPVTTSSNVDTNNVGTYQVTYTATDSSGNTATSTRTVDVTYHPHNGGGGSSSGSTGGSTGGTGTGTGGGQVLGAATYNFTANLGVGATGADVTALQQILIDGGYLHIPAPTGFFGPLTEAAVKAYQTAHGIPATGFVGPLTIAALNAGTIETTPVLSDAEKAAIFQELQNILKQIQEIQDALNKLSGSGS